ncbi:MAG: 50S ribosomal protein L29 [Candidatus Neomarinimicrobiota bacterium]|nr:50S ribosomal protein L29 [Candidatus Neomarinimicrobiota bacterium]RKY51291.1 MAG: 50S ribosomal protein L29 [Candidatus Neomarinimicrobiota bacterium]
MSKTELKELTREEAVIKLRDNEEALMNLRFQLTLQQLDNPLQIKKVKKEIAQLKTILREYELGKR